jgi:hypothetical protein
VQIGEMRKDRTMVDGLRAEVALQKCSEEYEELRNRFTQQLRLTIAEQVERLAKLKLTDMSRKAWKFDSHADCHRELRTYREILRILQSIDDKAFDKIRQHYSATFHDVYAKEIKSFFHALRHRARADKPADEAAILKQGSLGSNEFESQDSFSTSYSATLSTFNSTSSAPVNCEVAFSFAMHSTILPIVAAEHEFTEELFGFGSRSTRPLDAHMNDLFGANLLCEEFQALVTIGSRSPFLSVTMLGNTNVACAELEETKLSNGFMKQIVHRLRDWQALQFVQLVDARAKKISAQKPSLTSITSKTSIGVLPAVKEIVEYVSGMEGAVFRGYRSFVDTSYDTLFRSLLNWFNAAASKDKCVADRRSFSSAAVRRAAARMAQCVAFVPGRSFHACHAYFKTSATCSSSSSRRPCQNWFHTCTR